MPSRFVALLAFVGLSPTATLAQQDVRSATATDGIEIRYEVHGWDKAGPAVMFVHGWSEDRSFWDAHARTFATTNRVVTVDLPGFGESGGGRSTWSMEAYGQDVATVVDDLGLDDVVLVGFSMGAAVVLDAALHKPDAVRGVVLVDWLQDPLRKYSTEFVSGLREATAATWRDTAGIRKAVFSPGTPDSLVLLALEKRPQQVPQHWWSIADAIFAWANERLVPTLRALQVPVAAINSDDVPTNVEAYRQYVPAFEVRYAPGLGHLGVIWEHTTRFDQQLKELMQTFPRRERDGA